MRRSWEHQKGGFSFLTKCSEAVGLRGFSRKDTSGRTCSNTHRSRNRPPSTSNKRNARKAKVFMGGMFREADTQHRMGVVRQREAYRGCMSTALCPARCGVSRIHGAIVIESNQCPLHLCICAAAAAAITEPRQDTSIGFSPSLRLLTRQARHPLHQEQIATEHKGGVCVRG